MEAIYTLSNGRKVNVYLNEYSDLATYHYLKEDGTYYPKRIGTRVQKDTENGLKYFLVNGEKKYVDEFDYDPVDVLIERIKNSKSIIDLKDHEILATLLKDTDNVGIIANLHYASFLLTEDLRIIPLSFLFKGDYATILSVPTERFYKKGKWHYKLTLEAEDEQLRRFISYENYYLCDFCSLVKNGYMTIVNKNKYKEENKPKTLQMLLKPEYAKKTKFTKN